MEITSVQIQTAAAKDDFRAYAHITFDNCFRVNGLRLFGRPNGYELFMPSKKVPRGERVVLAHPITEEVKNRIKAAVIAEYERVTGETHAPEVGRQVNEFCRRLDELQDRSQGLSSVKREPMAVAEAVLCEASQRMVMAALSTSNPLKWAKMAMEVEFVRTALGRNNGIVSRAARELGISRVNLYELINRYSIRIQEFKVRPSTKKQKMRTEGV